MAQRADEEGGGDFGEFGLTERKMLKRPFSLDDAVIAFACFEKPSSYIDEDLYEPERLDYEEMLGGKPRELLTVNNFGISTWGPMCYLTAAAMAYLLPRLMEMAVSGVRDRTEDLFMMRFINHFSAGPAQPQYALFNANQRAVVTAFLEHLEAEHGELVAQECWEDVLTEGIRNWRSSLTTSP